MTAGIQVDALMARAETRPNEPGFGERVAESQKRVFQIAYGVLGNRAEAEDVAQEAFLNAYQHLSVLSDGEKFRAWVNRIAFRLALNRQRGLRRRWARDAAWQAATAETVDGVRNAEEHLLIEKLRSRIDALPEKYKRVLQLSMAEEMDAAGVGAVLGIPAGTVRSRLHTARKLLLEALQ